jgi:hypothetical protein
VIQDRRDGERFALIPLVAALAATGAGPAVADIAL